MTGHTILVVDDEPASVRAVTRTLGEAHRVIGATSAAQGLAALSAEPVALIIVDHRMPGMSGTELLAQCADRQPEMIRVLLTGYTDIETLLDAINAGHVYYYLTKPWEPGELRLVVQRGLEHYDVETDRRRLLGELEGAVRRARREAEQKGRLLALAAHELGTPLHLASNALMLLAETNQPPDAWSWLHTAQRSVNWLGRVVAQMVNAARWREGTMRLTCRSVDLRALFDELRRLYEPIVSNRKLALRVAAAPECPPVMADPIWLGRALANLLSNAVRFTPDGGCITMSASGSATTVCITVTDTGIGIDAGFLDELFEPFSAACGEVALHGSGTFAFAARGLGLGLAITKAIVDAHGGVISVTSEKAVGSRFAVTLPRVGSVSA